MKHGHRRRGFTLLEMLVVLAIVGILATAALPLVELSVRRGKEAELRAGLRELRHAIDAYKAAFDARRIAAAGSADDSGYPPSLEVLVDGVAEAASAATAGGTPPRRVYFLRRMPRDPFADPALPAAATWQTRSYASPPDAPAPGADVFDVLPTAPGTAIDGSPYRQW